MNDRAKPSVITAEMQNAKVLALLEDPALQELTSTVSPALPDDWPAGATPKTTEGPYYLSFDQSLLRSDITEDRKGVPLTLRYTVVDAATQAPVKGARVDTWHCDAFGYYSGYLSRHPDLFPGSEALSHIEPSDETRFLRGSQYTDESGGVEFSTVYPGWYHNRDVHIHMKVYVDDREVYVGQLHMPDDVNDIVGTLPPYDGHITLERLANDEDLLYQNDNGQDLVPDVRPVSEGNPEIGFIAAFRLAVVTS
jgi:protocatechuate 3,4-dioxygenase beta subunit